MAGIQPVMQEVLVTADRLYRKQGVHATITSALDGTHSAGSAHYYGYAVDFRIWSLGKGYKAKAKVLADKLQTVLGHRFYVLLEKDHIHVNLKQAYWK